MSNATTLKAPDPITVDFVEGHGKGVFLVLSPKADVSGGSVENYPGVFATGSGLIHCICENGEKTYRKINKEIHSMVLV
ncbi:hypothetical protein GCM10007392_05370 [Saccharospirillum salsuginis]|uniref:Uncharacterized protein n=1 Tax=Saccharospirillum salsuginis TaxID=418750 RepID=A0A918N5E7_9GAMM|nr:hypothetical protein GCM10007392_05370 [Saccharospirillum salsuginis]